MTGEIVPFPRARSVVPPKEAKEAAERVLATPVSERTPRASEIHLGESEVLLALCGLLDRRLDSAPASVAEDAAFLYDYLEGLGENPPTLLFDEREYYLGEFALLAGCANRHLTRREQATTWFDRAEGWFLLTASLMIDLARLAYQRLALKMEERQFGEVVRLVPPLRQAFLRSGAAELALKCRYLEAAALKEVDDLHKALTTFRRVRDEARAIGSARLLSSTCVIIVQIHCRLGEAEDAMKEIPEATHVLRESNDRIGLAKLHWGLANLLREQKKLPEAIETYRSAQKEFAALEMRADVAALNLVIGDLLLESGQERQAEWEVRAALPVIDELKMVPEGMAALQLLRESLRRRQIDRKALRDLHGYFGDSDR